MMLKRKKLEAARDRDSGGGGETLNEDKEIIGTVCSSFLPILLFA